MVVDRWLIISRGLLVWLALQELVITVILKVFSLKCNDDNITGSIHRGTWWLWLWSVCMVHNEKRISKAYMEYVVITWILITDIWHVFFNITVVINLEVKQGSCRVSICSFLGLDKILIKMVTDETTELKPFSKVKKRLRTFLSRPTIELQRLFALVILIERL